MEIEYAKDYIKFDKELNDFDKFALKFTKILDKMKVNYVLISGYVALLFGRSRMTEDIDVFIEKMSFEHFNTLWNRLTQEYECINVGSAEEAYNNYLLKNSAINFSVKNQYSLRMEVKFPKNEVDEWTLENRKKVILNGEILYISPLELQITYKLWLGRQGNEKDVEDAKHVYNLFKEHLDKEVFNDFIRKFNIQELYNKYLK